MRKYLFFLISITLFISCRTVKETQFLPKDKGYNLLPSLNIDCSVYYSKKLSLGNSIESDLTKIVKDEANTNITRFGQNSGRMEFTIGLNQNLLLYGPIVTGISFYTFSLLGFPVLPWKATVNITASIFDSNNKLINRITSTGEGKGATALYWGYTFKDGYKKAYLVAAKNAMEDLERKIQRDHSSIIAMLTSSPETQNSKILSPTTVSPTITSDVDENIPESSEKNENRFALIIGNEDYSTYQSGLNTEVNVSFAERDATIFKEYAIKTLGIPSENVLFKTNAKTIEMNKLIEQICSVIKNSAGSAEVFIYYAGHGFPDINTQEPYLIPVDCGGTDLKYAVKLDDLYNKLAEYPSKKVTVFLDACFSGGARNAGLVSARGVKVRPKSSQIKGNLIVFSASSAEQSAMAYKEKGHGIFTYYLLKKLQEDKGNLTYLELSNYLQKQVGVKSVLINATEQNPQTIISPDIENDWKDIKLK